ncbi:TPA: molecular chaperone [Escherichia coli]|nr:molecular chaperone [Escherichia coli]
MILFIVELQLMYFSRFSCNNIVIATALFIFSSVISAQHGGISLSQTRIVFSADKNTQLITVNNEGEQNYLIQSRVYRDARLEKTAPFIITPPLAKIEGGNKLHQRILFENENLPSDRESLFFLSVLAIPGKKQIIGETNTAGQLSMGFRFIVKLFYRPQSLGVPAADTACRLEFFHSAKGIEVSNPTPWYQTFSQLTINNKFVELKDNNSMIAPMSRQYYSWTETADIAKWQTINDYGGLSPLCQQYIK